jgi:hypothetical protein
MQARAGSRSDTALRLAFASLLVCAIALAIGVAGRPAHGHHHSSRAVVAVALTVADTPQVGLRSDLLGDVAPAAAPLQLHRGGVATADASISASSATAQSPQVRGPPVQAAV